MNNSIRIFRKCPLCQCNNDFQEQKLGVLRNKNFIGIKEYFLVCCFECNLIYLSPLPTNEVFEDIYVRHTQFIDSADYTGERVESIIKYYVDRLSCIIKTNKIPSNSLKILEIGSGLSWISRAAKLINPNSLTIAQDITEEVKNVCNWVDHYFVGNIIDELDSIKKYSPYNLISLTHVIEHLPDPIYILKELRDLLNSNGVILITTPYRPIGWNISKPFAIWEEWSYNHVPAHLQYFNRNSLSYCAEELCLNLEYFTDNEDNGQAIEAWLKLV
jgi:SAM-dependent methyltransferase